MKTLVILAHPNFDQSRSNRRLIEELKGNNTITFHHLDEVYPDEVIDVAYEQELLRSHDRIVFQYPLYWYNMPSLLRKWQDNVLEYNWAFGPNGDKLALKECVVVVTTGGPEDAYQAGGYNNYTLSELLRPMQQTAQLTQMEYLPSFHIHNVLRLSDEELEVQAKAYIEHITNPLVNPKVAKAALDAEMKEKGIEL